MIHIFEMTTLPQNIENKCLCYGNKKPFKFIIFVDFVYFFLRQKLVQELKI